MANPVPFPYFHVLTLLLLLDLLLISYGLVDAGYNAFFTAFTYMLICVVFLGLREVAIAMSDPFGDDVTDFDLEKMLKGSFNNAVAILSDTRPSQGSQLVELANPLTNQGARFTIQLDGAPALPPAKNEIKQQLVGNTPSERV